MTSQLPPSYPPRTARRSRSGCLGCLGQIVGGLIVAVIVVPLMWAIFAPWAYYAGGRFHLTPGWSGWGRMHSSHAGDYALWVQIYPGRTSRTTGFPGVTGSAILCTPRHERFNLKLGGSFLNKHLGSNTDGQPMHLYMHYRSAFGGDQRPGLELYGKWEGLNLVMEDHSSLARAFLPDGSVDRGSRKNLPWMIEQVSITLIAGDRSTFDHACEELPTPHSE